MKPHTLFQIMRPDEVAECLDGVGNTPLYAKLWSFVPDYKKRDKELELECPPDPDFNCLAGFWRRLEPKDQAILNILAEKYEARYDRPL